MRSFPLVVAACLVAFVGAGGCAVSRHDQVKASSREAQSVLEEQLDMAMADATPTRDARIDRLTSIRYQLGAANVALGVAPYALKEPAELETAYTFLEEFFGTLEWNAKLPPDQPVRALPANPLPGKLNLMPANAAPMGAAPSSTPYPTLVPTR